LFGVGPANEKDVGHGWLILTLAFVSRQKGVSALATQFGVLPCGPTGLPGMQALSQGKEPSSHVARIRRNVRPCHGKALHAHT
jgi:hypothetical protein